MRIDQKLNLVIPVDTVTRGVVHVHSTPISRDVFKTYYLILSKTYSQIFGQGLSHVSGPRVANFMLEDIAKQTQRRPGQDWWDGPDGVARGLVGEIRRRTNVCCVAETGGWETIPYDYVIQQKVFTEDEIDQLEGAIVFFIVISALMDPEGKAEMLDGMRFLWAVQITSLNCTEFAASLPISTEVETTQSHSEAAVEVPLAESTEAPLGVPVDPQTRTWSPPS
jgi:hypothetical protein